MNFIKRLLWIIAYKIGDILGTNEKPYLGVGKTQILRRHARETGTKVVELKLPIVNDLKEDDLLGLPSIKKD